MNLLVTGGAGYVGSHCVRELVRAGHRVVVFDNLKKGHRGAVDPPATLVIGDLADATLVEQTFAAGGYDAVMHFAAYAEVGESVSDPLLYYANNVACSVGLLSAMQRNGVRALVFSSSCAVYGVPLATPIVESSPKLPISPYGRSKLAIEWVMEDCARAFGLRGAALRYFNAAGAAADGSIGEDHEPESHLIPRVLQVALGMHQNVTIFGDDYDTPDGTCVRDYIHVEDLATAHRLAIENLSSGVTSARGDRSRLAETGSFAAYNLGTGRGVSVREIVDAAREVTGHAIPVEVGPRRPGDPPQLYADARAAERAFGWKAKYTDIRETIATAWRWHRAHRRGFAK